MIGPEPNRLQRGWWEMPTGYEMSPMLLAAVKRESEDKDVQWVGCPNPAVTLRSSFGATWFFAVPWTAFSLFWMMSASGGIFTGSKPASAFNYVLLLFGLPFVAIGVGMLAAPFWATRKARSTAHLVTADSVVTVAFDIRGNIETKTVPLTSIGEIKRTELADGFGTLTLHTGWQLDGEGGRSKVEHVLHGIPEARAVETLILRLRGVRPGTA